MHQVGVKVISLDEIWTYVGVRLGSPALADISRAMHSNSLNFENALRLTPAQLAVKIISNKRRSVAQLGRASVSKTECRGFESCRSCHRIPKIASRITRVLQNRSAFLFRHSSRSSPPTYTPRRWKAEAWFPVSGSLPTYTPRVLHCVHAGIWLHIRELRSPQPMMQPTHTPHA